VTAERDRALSTLTEAWLGLHQLAPGNAITILRAEELRPGRPAGS
jgi:hypothetical protein